MPRPRVLLVSRCPCHAAGTHMLLLLTRRVGIHLVPAVSKQGSLEVLRQLRVEWPCGGAASPDTVSALKQALSRCPYAAACEPGAASLPEDVVCKVHLKSFIQQQGLAGYDPNLDVLLGEPHVGGVWCNGNGERLQKACLLFPVLTENKGRLGSDSFLLLLPSNLV